MFMNYRFFADTGVEVSELAMGTQTWGWGADVKTSHEIADRFVEAGGNFFDTANIYNDGVSEKMLGSWRPPTKPIKLQALAQEKGT